ncbi:MAG: peptidylprolyl isomerase [Rhodospirillales bacterium]|nr:peptidylprolyl isomerase [Rhodospirillales bacterium]
MKARILATALGGALLMTVSAPVFAEDKDPSKQVAAVVNNEKIYRNEVEDARFLLPREYQNLPLKVVYPQLLNSIIDRKLTAAAGRKEGLANNADVKEQLARIEEQLLQRAYLAKHITSQVSDDKLKAAYETLKASTPQEDEVHARHILLETEEQANEVIKAIAGGKDFAELAKEKSKGPSGANGGDLGFFKAGAMVPEFSKAAFEMKPGESSKTAIRTQFGWHVIKVEERRPIKAPTFEEAKPQLENEVAREIGADILGKLRTNASIERFDLEGKVIAAPTAPAAPEKK